jgi:hypothetical protein
MSRVAMSLLLLSACAGSQDGRSTTPQGAATMTPPGETAPKAGGDPDEEVCQEEAPTGSAVKRVTCRSRAQVERDRQNAEEMQRRGNQLPSAGGPATKR